MSTVVMRVDLDCDKCYKKIRKAICKLQDRVSIGTISYDVKSKTVTVSGPFDAEEIADRLTSDAGKVITDIHVVGQGNQKRGAKAPKPGKVSGHGSHVGGNGHSHGGRVGGNGHSHGGRVGGNGEHGGGGGKPEKKHVKFDDLDSDFDDEPADRHAHHGHSKPKIVTTATAARLEAPHTGPSMSMVAAAPVRMPAMAPLPQATAVPSIWPAAPEWGHSAPPYGGYGGAGGPPVGGYYGGPATYGHGGYGPYGYGRDPYGPQHYDEEPSAGCSVM
ncbi:uncharacterized protein LOC133912686 isoform X2 [Phragmites australis]|nr:uncharacterized protein LOC133912686 isoform X2 [Phragmites australis]XP_062211529.1 uncharacterized protein LOC133912686 isoform X2 [Phragmites australis]